MSAPFTEIIINVEIQEDCIQTNFIKLGKSGVAYIKYHYELYHMQCADNRMNMVFKRNMRDTGIFNVPRQDLRCTGLSTNDRYSDQFFVFIY